MGNALLPFAVLLLKAHGEEALAAKCPVSWRFCVVRVGSIDITHCLLTRKGDLVGSDPDNRTIFLVQIVQSLGPHAGIVEVDEPYAGDPGKKRPRNFA